MCNIFICLIALCVFEVSFKGFGLLFNQVVFSYCFFFFKGSVYILDSGPLSYIYYKYFIPVCGLPIYSLDSLFSRAEEFSSNKV